VWLEWPRQLLGRPSTPCVTGAVLFVAPHGRFFEELESESRMHGWPSFRDKEMVWDSVRVLKDGETVSSTGTHPGHNLPDRVATATTPTSCVLRATPLK